MVLEEMGDLLHIPFCFLEQDEGLDANNEDWM